MEAISSDNLNTLTQVHKKDTKHLRKTPFSALNEAIDKDVIDISADAERAIKESTTKSDSNNAQDGVQFTNYAFSLANGTYQISVPSKDWTIKLQGQNGVSVYKKDDKFTGVERSIHWGRGNMSVKDFMVHVLRAIRQSVGSDISVIEYKVDNSAGGSGDGSISTGNAVIEFKYDNKTYRATVEVGVLNANGGWAGEISITSYRKDSQAQDLRILEKINKSFKKVDN